MFNEGLKEDLKEKEEVINLFEDKYGTLDNPIAKALNKRNSELFDWGDGVGLDMDFETPPFNSNFLSNITTLNPVSFLAPKEFVSKKAQTEVNQQERSQQTPVVTLQQAEMQTEVMESTNRIIQTENAILEEVETQTQIQEFEEREAQTEILISNDNETQTILQVSEFGVQVTADTNAIDTDTNDLMTY